MIKAPPPLSNTELKCGICGIEDYPLKKVRKNDWYHITCLVMHDMSIIFNLFRKKTNFSSSKGQYKNGEWMLKQEKNNVLEQIKNEGSQYECFICKTKVGICVKCDDKTCTKHFHALCAYVSGYKIKFVDYEDHKEDKAKNGLRPIIQCPDHTGEPDVFFFCF